MAALSFSTHIKPLMRLTAGLRARKLVAAFSPKAQAAPEPLVAPLAAIPDTAPPVAAAPPPPPPDPIPWSDKLWGQGLAQPGGAEEVLRLSALLPLDKEATLLVIGRGATASGAAVAVKRGPWIQAYDAEASYTRRAHPLPRLAAKRVTSASWAPVKPEFPAKKHTHALVLDAFRQGAAPGPLLAAVGASLKSGGQLVLSELVTVPGQEETPDFERWLKLERRAAPPTEAAVQKALKAAKFDLHVCEDNGQRQATDVMPAWLDLLKELEASPTRMRPIDAGALVMECEAWLLRMRLLQSGALKTLRWHASHRGSLM